MIQRGADAVSGGPRREQLQVHEYQRAGGYHISEWLPHQRRGYDFSEGVARPIVYWVVSLRLCRHGRSETTRTTKASNPDDKRAAGDAQQFMR